MQTLRSVPKRSLVVLVLTCVAMQPAISQEENRFYFASVAKRLYQASRVFEILSSGNCAHYTRGSQTSRSDLSVMMTTVRGAGTDAVRAKFRSIVDEVHAEERQNLETIAVIQRGAGGPDATEEFRCGFVLGLASVSLAQARSEWAKTHVMPEQQLPLP